MSDLDHHSAPQYAAAVLQWYLDNGVDETMLDAPQDRLATKEVVPLTVAVIVGQSTPQSPSVAIAAPLAAPLPSASEYTSQAIELAKGAHDIESLRQGIASFEGLVIRKTAMNMVFAEGSPGARLMVVGDVPETDEDRFGLPFQGAQGVLLDKMLGAIGVSRAGDRPENAAYLTQMLNWRPPGNRTPNDQEIQLSRIFLERHIALVKPQILLLVGPLVAKILIGSSVSKLRGSIHVFRPHYAELGGSEVSCVVTHPPAVLLKTPLKKREAWADLLMVKAAFK